MQREVWLLLNVCVLTLPKRWVKVQSKSVFFNESFSTYKTVKHPTALTKQ